ncbi:MAG: hypothetical protein Q9160_003745, partial [Pyrenula sp. 1 TL-2023]
STRQSYIVDFYNYRAKNRSVREAWGDLKDLARKVRQYGNNQSKDSMTPERILERLVTVLPNKHLQQLGELINNRNDLLVEEKAIAHQSIYTTHKVLLAAKVHPIGAVETPRANTTVVLTAGNLPSSPHQAPRKPTPRRVTRDTVKRDIAAEDTLIEKR